MKLNNKPKFTFFRYSALDAVSMSWDNLHLKHILSSDTYCSHIPESSLISGSFNSQGQPLWHGKSSKSDRRQNFIVWTEPLATCAARVDALRSHGHQEAALRLAVAVVRTMKQQQLANQRKWHESQQQQRHAAGSSSNNANSGSSSNSSSRFVTHTLDESIIQSFFFLLAKIWLLHLVRRDARQSRIAVNQTHLYHQVATTPVAIVIVLFVIGGTCIAKPPDAIVNNHLQVLVTAVVPAKRKKAGLDTPLILLDAFSMS